MKISKVKILSCCYNKNKNKNMKSHPLVKIGAIDFRQHSGSSGNTECSIFDEYDYLKGTAVGQIAILLADYLVKYSKKFDKALFYTTPNRSAQTENGSWIGDIGCINRSEIDIAVLRHNMDEYSKAAADFTYPFKMSHYTFATRKPEYTPQIFGILQTFSLSLWIAIIVALIAMIFVHYVAFKRKYSFDKISLQVFAVLLRQSSMLRLSSVAGKLIVYSWVVGGMFLCLAYDSVFLSFLAIPPVTLVKNAEELARAVEKEKYHCVTHPQERRYLSGTLFDLELEKFRIIGEDIEKNNFHFDDFFTNLVSEKNQQNLAIILDEISLIYIEGLTFISEDRFLDFLTAMIVRKDFCCKEMLEMFVHRMMDTGLFFKLQKDRQTFIHLRYFNVFTGKDTTSRKLTLIDVAPAFIVLLSGYFVSFLVLIGEIVLCRCKKAKFSKDGKKRKKEDNV